jgi:hypothetical protein
MLLIPLIALSPLLLCQKSALPTTGSVQGVVVDIDNRPVTGAIVFGLPEADMRHQLRTTTDSDGRFALVDVPVGAIYIDAYNESAGYPYSFFSFFKVDDRPVKVSVVAGQNTKDVVIRFGPKAAHLNIEITDQGGTRGIEGARLVFSRDAMPGAYRRGARPKESILVPTVPFRLTVEVPGYKAWHYGGDNWQGKAGLIALKPEESLTLKVRLVPQ